MGESLLPQIDQKRVPQHVAIIMDGNGRWAKGKGKFRIFGHRNGVQSVRAATEAAAEIGVKVLTLYAFSTENWNRPKREVQALMSLLVQTIKAEIPTLQKNKIKLATIGDFDQLPEDCQRELQAAMEQTKDNNHMTLVLALSYSSRWDLTRAVNALMQDVQHGKIAATAIDETTISQYLSTAPYPDPELLIRTSGEHRISNFLLWEIAYAEFYFLDKFWPDFTKTDFYEAILAFQRRERRFGKTSEQLTI